MPSIKSLEMAGAVSSHKNITIKKSLFFTKATYTPTQSGIKTMIKEYSPTEGDRLERLLNMPIDKMRDEIQRKGKPIEGAVGNYRLEACLSADHQFCAMQLFRFTELDYRPVTEPLFYEGPEADWAAQLL